MALGRDWNYRQLAAEFLATLLFVWVGCGAAVASNRWTIAGVNDPAFITSVALAFGISIAVLAYSVGHISGGHINPAVTLAFMLLRLQSITAGLLYMAAQVVGAVVGALIVWGCNASIKGHCGQDTAAGKSAELHGACAPGPPFGLGVNVVGPQVAVACAFLLEFMGTFFLVFTVLHAAVHYKSTGGNAVPIAIGWSILCVHLILIPYTGCGINPARSFGPMFVSAWGGGNYWKRGWWVFYTAPFVGSYCATACYRFIFQHTPDPTEVGKKKKNDDTADGHDADEIRRKSQLTGDDIEHAVPQIYDEEAKNTGTEGKTESGVAKIYE